MRNATPAVQNVTLEIETGRMVAILGANGSGKSTLARLMNGLLLPSRGEVVVDGRSTADLSALQEIRRRVGMVFQSPENQIVSSSVEHDVAFGLENLCINGAEMRLRVDQALAAVGLSGRGADNPHDLSASQKQRLAVAGVLAVQPDYLILDEATSFLDGADRQDLLDTVTHLRDSTTLSIVLITHLMEEALLADRAIVMSGGRVVFDGLPLDLFSLSPEHLASWRLQVPDLVTLADQLRQEGISLPEAPVTPNALVNMLCS